jgi:hypothetical protein
MRQHFPHFVEAMPAGVGWCHVGNDLTGVIITFIDEYDDVFGSNDKCLVPKMR